MPDGERIGGELNERPGLSMRAYAFEAWYEFRSGLRGPMVPLMFAGLVGYVWLMLASADFLREMGAADVPRNSALVIYQMTSGQAFWLIFVWAWVFAQVVARDRGARLHEVVLASPISLRGLLIARYLGALGLALILGSSSSIAMLMVPMMAKLGVFPEASVAATPLTAMGHAWALFVLPTALGLGALYVAAALRTRSPVGPFAASAAVIVLWMVAMITLRGADTHAELATLIDVSGFGEAEYQSKLWTPAAKQASLMALTPALIWNRALWTLIPVAVLGLSLLRLRRDALVLERAERARTMGAAQVPVVLGSAPLAPVHRPPWIQALVSEALWKLRNQALGWPFLVSMGLWFVMNAAVPFAHMLGHAEGPLVPRGHVLAPFLVDQSYLFSVFGIAAFVGTLVRRDRQSGMGEIVDATCAPLGIRVGALALAGLAVTLVFTLIPALSAFAVMALHIPGAFDPWSPLLVSALMATPGLLELGAITFLVHSLVRSPGTAHALSMFAALVAIVNLELGIVTYPPGLFGVTAHVPLSEIQGYAPWLAGVVTLDLYKGALVALVVAIAWLVFPRGTALTFKTRLVQARRRLPGGAGVMVGAALLASLGLGWVLRDRLVSRGEYQTRFERVAEDAAWERAFWSRPAPFTVKGGRAHVRLNAESARVYTVLALEGVRAPEGRLGGALPLGTQTVVARVDGIARDVTVDADQFEVRVEGCRRKDCAVTLEVEIAQDGWYLEDTPPWLQRSGVWARAADVVPRLGLDPDRLLRSPAERREHALDETPRSPERAALVAALGVLPAGDFQWRAEMASEGRHTALTGRAAGRPLDFAFAWLPANAAVRTLKQGALTAWHGVSSKQVAGEILEDVVGMQRCLQQQAGLPVVVTDVLQVPRGLGPVALHDSVLWLPEDEGWDVASEGVGRNKRRASIGEALAATALAQRANMRREPGSRLLTAGLAGHLGLACLHEATGTEAWVAWLARRSDHVAEALGALDAPLIGLAEDGPADWVQAYAPLATAAWAQTLSTTEFQATLSSLMTQLAQGTPVRTGLDQTLGRELAAALLGVPHAADVSVSETAAGMQVRGAQQRWADGGWESHGALRQVTRYSDDGQVRVDSLPLDLDPKERVTAFAAEPSYERSPVDNRWPRPSP